MSVPNIEVIVYPVGPSATERQVQYLELAPANTMLDPVCPLPLQIWIKNNQGANLTLTEIAAEFSDPTLNKTIPVTVPIGPGSSTAWYASNPQYIILPSPPPPSFKLKLTFADFDPWSDKVFLVPFPDSFHFPGKFADLAKGEFWLGSGMSHAGGGDQLFHYDLGMMGWDPTKGEWRDVFPGKDGSKNEDFRIWGRPVYALADGVVTFYTNNIDNNPAPGNPLPTPGYGNAYNIQHGPYLATYMHFQKGSLNPNIITGYPEGVEFANGPTVKAGDFLGLAGNSGHSFGPHLHVGLVIRDANKTQFSIPLPFSDVWVSQDSDMPGGDYADALWVKADDQGLAFTKAKGAVALAPIQHGLHIFEAAIDPVALVLGASSAVYVRLTLPDPPPIETLIAQVQAQVRGLSPEERRSAMDRVKGLREYVDVLERELDR
jgi:hypothetical protein